MVTESVPTYLALRVYNTFCLKFRDLITQCMQLSVYKHIHGHKKKRFKFVPYVTYIYLLVYL